MNILAIDPGTTSSGILLLENGEITAKLGEADNEWIVELIRGHGCTDDCPEFANIGLRADVLAIEMVAHYGTGMPAGKEVFDTCVWIGRIIQAAYEHRVGYVRQIFRRDIKLHLCGNCRAKDPNVRQALIDKYGAPGTKKAPGFTYGISGHLWSALAIADYVASNRQKLELLDL